VTDFIEVAERVWVARYEWADANVTAIGSDRGLVVVDTHGSTAAGRTVIGDLRRLGAGPVAAVVNTHWHWDHSFGNAAFREAFPSVPIHAHEEAAAMLADKGEYMKGRFAEFPDEPHSDEVAETELVIPDQTFASTQVLDLGDRTVELVFPGRGHTSGDLVVRVADVDVVLGGDLIEESAKPWIGMDSWPLEWAPSLDAFLSLIGDATIVVPGHGVPVDRAFVTAQQGDLAAIAETVRRLAARAVPLEAAAAEGEWPWDTDDRIQNAVRRGYEQLSLEPSDAPPA
jgi:glyoxylase-like metal-dependent hydrolase (beta-lactamase superfamily II)